MAALGTFRQRRRLDRPVAAARPEAVADVLSLATFSTPTAGCRRWPRRGRRADPGAKLDLIAATPQAELLEGFWNAPTGQARLVRMLEQQPAPDKESIFDAAVADAQRRIRP